MVVVPAATPLTRPLVPTVAALGLVLLHTPPVVASERPVKLVENIDKVPEIALTVGITVTVTFNVEAVMQPKLFVTV